MLWTTLAITGNIVGFIGALFFMHGLLSLFSHIMRGRGETGLLQDNDLPPVPSNWGPSSWILIGVVGMLLGVWFCLKSGMTYEDLFLL